MNTNANEQADLDRHPVASSTELGDAVPIIDIDSFSGGVDSSAAAGAVAQIAQACRDWGFFQVVNHGISSTLIDAQWQQTRRFFAQPMRQKEAILRTRANPWGYYNNELTKNQRDKKEVFDYTTEGADPIYESENRWPAGQAAFRDTMLAYLKANSDLGLRLLQAFSVGLNLPPETMQEDFAERHTGFVRLNYYPVTDPLVGSPVPHQPLADYGVHHHTDAGALTVVLQDDVGGLQVYRDGYWHNIPPVPGALVINTGDMIQIWSNDIYRAPIHRVAAMDSTDRYSIPFFFNPAASARVKPLPTAISDERPARYLEVSWAEFRARRTDGDYADYGTEVQISHYRL